MSTKSRPDDTDHDLRPEFADPLTAPTKPLPLNTPTQPLTRDGQTQLIVRDGLTELIAQDGLTRPTGDITPTADQSRPPETPSNTKYKAEFLEAHPETTKEPAGQKAASFSGIERDSELKEMPGAILDIELRIAPYLDLNAQNPQKAFSIVKCAIARFNGALLHFLPAPKGYLRCQCIFPNKAQAHNAAVYIHQNSDTEEDSSTPIKKAKFGLAADDISLATYNGHLLVLGNAARMAFKLQNANPEYAIDYTIPTHEKGRLPLGNALSEGPLTEIVSLHSRATEKSKDHAQNAVKLPNPDLPQVASRVEIRFPQALVENPEEMLKIATRLLDAISPHPMPKGARYTPTHAHLIGHVMTVYLPEERAPGNLGERLIGLTSEIEENNLKVILSHSKYTAIKLDDNNHTFQGALPPTANLGEDIELDQHGIYIDEDFKEAAEHERNTSIARFQSESTPSATYTLLAPPTSQKEISIDKRIEKGKFEHKNLYKVQNIEVSKEAIVKGRYTVGRKTELADLRTTLTKVHQEKRGEFTVISGEAGIGKTRHAIDAINIATEQGFSSVYYKTPENGKTASLTGIRRMTKNLLATLPLSAIENFRDLQFFSDGIVPPGEIDRYGKSVEALNQNQALAADRLQTLIATCAQRTPFQLILDDLQWFDELSIAILKKIIEDLPEKTQVHLALLGRSGEEPIPQDLIEAMAKRTGHYHETTLKRIGDPESLKADIKAESPEITNEELTDKVAKERFELTKAYIYSNLPEEYTSARLTDGFVWKMLEISQGLPIVISEMISFLLEEGKIAIAEDKIITPTNEELDALKGENATETLSTIIQAKFDRLNEDEKEVVDYLVVLGETDVRLLDALLKHLHFSEERIGGTIASLKQKGIIKTKPISFTHDLIQKQREMHLQGRGSLSRKAAQCYLPLAKNRSRYSTLISPSQVFGVLEIALKHPEECDETMRAQLYQDRVPLGLEAADHNLQTQNQYRALQIVESLETGLYAELSSHSYQPKSEESDEQEKKTALTINLGEVHLRAAEAHIRLGHKTEPESTLLKYARIADEVPNAGLKEGEKGSRYKVLRMKASFVKRSPSDLKAAMTELEASPEFVALKVATTQAGVEEAQPPGYVLIAYGELALAKLRLAGLRQSRDGYNATLPTALEISEKLAASNSKACKALRLDISRSIHVYDAHLYRKEICGEVEDAFYMQEFTSAQRARAQALEQELTRILQAYLNDTELVRDPQTLGFLYERLADMQIVQGNREEAGKTIERGLRLSNNWGIPEAVGALSALYGDVRTTAEIAKLDPEAPETIDCAQNFDMESLEKALESYSQGILAMERMGATGALYLVMNIANKTLCLALYTFAKLRENPEFDTANMKAKTGLHMPSAVKMLEIEKLTSQIRLTWTAMVRVILQLNTHYKAKIPNDPYIEVYLDELCTLGLLYKAAKRMGIEDLAVPDFVEFAEVNKQNHHLNDAISKPKKPLSGADKKYLKLRKEGIIALMPGGMEAEFSLADLEGLL